MIDTHCHLTDPRLGSQLDAVLSRAAAAGVGRMISIATSIADSFAAAELCRRHAQVRCAVGVHPNHVKEETAAVEELKTLLNEPAVVAVGEIGLDYHYSKQPAELARQHDWFTRQLQVAIDADKPVVVHCREAVDDALAILKDFPAIRAVFHCFTGSSAEAKRILDAGYLLGFTGVVTFKKSDDLRAAVRLTHSDRLLVETDAPYLSPEPMRNQKINEPALVMHVAAVVARERGIGIDALDELITGNAERFFAMN